MAEQLKQYIFTFLYFDKDLRFEATAKLRTKPITEKEMRRLLKREIAERKNAIWDAKTIAGRPV